MYIYKTTNKTTNKIYIGQHKGTRENYIGSGVYLKKAIEKYGKENFHKEILEKCQSEEMLDDREIYWISYYNSTDREIGYNISPGGGVGMLKDFLTGVPKTEEHKKNISKNHADVTGDKNPMYGKTHSEETMDIIKSKIKKWKEDIGFSNEQIEYMSFINSGRKNNNYNPSVVCQYNIDMELIKEWKDLLTLKENGFDSKSISQNCRGRYKTSQGFIWKFKE